MQKIRCTTGLSLALSVVLSLGVLVLSPVAEAGRGDPDSPRVRAKTGQFNERISTTRERKRNTCRVISKQRAMSLATRGSDARALSATLHRSAGEAYYRVKVVSGKKRIKVVRIRACA